MILSKNEIHTAMITGYTAEGDGVCRINGQVVFVPGGVCHDELSVKILRVNKHIAYGKTEEILKPSPNRITPECEYADKCGGCNLWHMSYDEEIRFKREKVENALARLGGVDIKAEDIIPSDNITRYRNKAQYPVSTDGGRAITGFYKRATHDIIAIDDCLIQSTDASNIARAFRSWIDNFNVRVYNPKTHTGIIRHLYIRSGVVSGEILVTIVASKAKLFYVDSLIEMLTKSCDKISGIILNVNGDKTNRILGKKNIRIWGCEFLSDKMCGNEFVLSPLAFYQVNHSQAEKMYEAVIDFADLTKESIVLDLYCGAGTISLALAKHCKKVIAIDIVEDAILNARNNAEINDIKNVRFINCDAIDAISSMNTDILDKDGAVIYPSENISQVDTLVVDPPRKGLESIEEVININAKKIVYVSCDPGSLARDVKLLTAEGYKVKRLKIFDMFPRTFHAESVLLLEKGTN